VKLFYTETSPFARVVRVAIFHKGMVAQVEQVKVTVRDKQSQLLKYSPTGKVPALLTKDNDLLMESRVICEYLDHVNPAAPFMAKVTDGKARALEGAAMSFLDGIAVWVRELRRVEIERSPGVIAHEQARAQRCLDFFDTLAEQLTELPCFSQVTLASGLMIVNFLPLDWQASHQKLADWFELYLTLLPPEVLT
jgi:glutathione S-transferase